MKRKPPKFILLDSINVEVRVRQDIPEKTLISLQRELKTTLPVDVELMVKVLLSRAKPYLKVKLT